MASQGDTLSSKFVFIVGFLVLLIACRSYADYSSVVLSDGAAPYYRLDEQTGRTAVDASPLNLHGAYTAGWCPPACPPDDVIFGEAGILLGDPGSSVFMVGSGVVVPPRADTASYTIEGWFRLTGSVAPRALIARHDATDTWVHALLTNSAGKFQYTVKGTVGSSVVSSTTVIADTTYHVAATLEASGRIHLYINGVEEGTSTLVGAPLSGTNWQAGLASSDGGSPFYGNMDALAFYSTALTAGQISAHYAAGNSAPNSTQTPVPTNTATPTSSPLPTHTGQPTPTASATSVSTPPNGVYSVVVLSDGAGPYYKLEELAGRTAVDASPLGLHGSYTAGWCPPACPPDDVVFGQTGLPPGDPGHSAFMVGSGVTAPVTASTQSYTIEGWFRPTGSVAPRALIGRLDATDNWVHVLLINSSSKFQFIVNGTVTGSVVGTTTVMPDTTYHVVATLEANGRIRLYINGMEEGVSALVTTPISGTYWQAGIAGSGGGSPFYGHMDELAFYPTALSASQVWSHYTVGNPTPTLTATRAPTRTRTPTLSPVPTYTGQPTSTPSATGTPTPTRTPTLTAISTPLGSRSDFALRYVDHTGIQIAMAWDSVTTAAGYVVQRDTTPFFNSSALVSYTTDATVNGLGDTGWPLDDWRRFQRRSTASLSPIYHLQSATGYYYRVLAQTSSGTQTSNIIGPCTLADYHHADEIVRGQPGDLWADAVLGQAGFAENTFLGTDPYHTQYGGGVTVDYAATGRTHVFLVDGNHNRILGLEGVGRCRFSEEICSIDSDCEPGERCDLTPGEIAPAFVLGQPSDTGFSACNGDGTRQTFPNYPAPNASTLCLLSPDSISIGESVIHIQNAVDADHNLYVPDEWNHRVLMYRDPFDPSNGTAAAEVWGQDNFEANKCNRGGLPTMASLCFPTSVAIDGSGNLWVVDSAESNSRVLRFPRNASTGGVEKTADLALTGLWHPTSVQVDAQGDLYVSGSFGVWRFANPQPGAANPHQSLDFITYDLDYGSASQIALDPRYPGRIWVEMSSATQALFDVHSQQMLTKLRSGQFRGLTVSHEGDLFTVDAWSNTGLFRLAPGETPPSGSPGTPAFLGVGAVTKDSLWGVSGITIVGDQLLVSDNDGVRFWNDYRRVTQGNEISPLPDGMWQSPSAAGHPGYRIAGDDSGRIWIVVGNDATHLHLFAAPLTTNSAPIKSISISKYKDATGSIRTLPGSGPTIPPLTFFRFFPVGSGDQVWFSEGEGPARILRATNIDGLEDPGQPAYVDTILGQQDLQSYYVNQGRGTWAYDRDTLGAENLPLLDSAGNLFVQTNATGGQDGGYSQILRWNTGTIPDHPTQVLLNIPADSIYGNGGPQDFTLATALNNPRYPLAAHDVAAPVRAPAFDSSGRMILGGANPYIGPRFPMVYLNKDQNYQPQLVLGDYVSFAAVSYFDRDGNLYLADWDWTRVLVYKAPLLHFATALQTPLPTTTLTLTATQTLTPTLTPASTQTDTPTATPTLSSTSLPSASETTTPTEVPTTTPTPPPAPTATPRFAIECPIAPVQCTYTAARNSLEVTSKGARSNFEWSWKRGTTSLSQAAFGDPVTGASSYALCLYEQADPAQYSLAMVLRIAPEMCGTTPCWKTLGTKGWRYKNPWGNESGVVRVVLAGGEAGRPSLKVVGKGSNLPVPVPSNDEQLLDQNPTVVVQLHSSASEDCWSSVFDSSSTKKSDRTEFQAAAR